MRESCGDRMAGQEAMEPATEIDPRAARLVPSDREGEGRCVLHACGPLPGAGTQTGDRTESRRSGSEPARLPEWTGVIGRMMKVPVRAISGRSRNLRSETRE